MSSGADDLCTDTCQYTGALEVLSPIWWGAGSKIESSQVDLARKKEPATPSSGTQKIKTLTESPQAPYASGPDRAWTK